MSSSAKITLAVGGILLLTIMLALTTLISEPPQRKVVLYDYNGKVLKEYTGKITNIFRNNGGLRFKADGRRVILQGGIAVIEEE